MRFESIRLKGIGPFREEQFVDLTQYPGALVSISGSNGAGKSTLLGCLAGALYREVPTRGTLASLATSRDAFVEVGACNGASYKVRQTVDHISKHGETLITDAAGEPVLDNAKVSSGDRWIADHFPSAAVLYSSSFSPQGRRGFLDMSKSERKQLLVEILDLQRFERMAGEARERAALAKGDLALLRSRLSDLALPDTERLEADAVLAQERATQAQAALDTARTLLERARAAAGDAERARELAEQRKSAVARQAAAQKQVGDVELRLANNRELLNRSEEIRAAETRDEELQGELVAAKDALVAAQSQFDAANARSAAAVAAHGQALGEAQRAKARATTAEGRLKDRDAVFAATGELVGLRETEIGLSLEQETHRQEIRRLGDLLLSGKDRRIDGLRAGLEEICGGGGEDARDEAYECLTQDEGIATAQAEAPAALSAAKAAEDLARTHLEAVRKRLTATERLAARADEMEAAQRDHEAALAEHAAVAATLPGLEQAREGARAASTEQALLVEAAACMPATIVAALTGLQPLLAQLPRLEQATARVEELSTQLESLRTTLAAADAELATLPVVDVEAIDLGAHERTVAAREVDQRSAQAALTRAQDAVSAGEATLAKRVEVQRQVSATEAELADWTRLAQDLGRDGLQALELDACLPEINAIANHLLVSCYGPRFTIELKTDRLSADGKKVIEDLECRVLDMVNGRDADADTYSGGELVLVSTAISLALTTIACRRAGIERPTICLDEAGAALDAENGRAWIAMLRLAGRQLDASAVLFISHSLEQQSLADVQISIADGKVSVAA